MDKQANELLEKMQAIIRVHGIGNCNKQLGKAIGDSVASFSDEIAINFLANVLVLATYTSCDLADKLQARNN